MDLSINGEAYKAAVQAFVMAGATSSEARNASSWPRDNGWFETRVGATSPACDFLLLNRCLVIADSLCGWCRMNRQTDRSHAMNIDPIVQAAANERAALADRCRISARAAILRSFLENPAPMSMATACWPQFVEASFAPLHGGRFDSGLRQESARRVFREMCEDRTLGHVGWSAGGDYAYRPASDAAWSGKITGQIEGQPDTMVRA